MKLNAENVDFIFKCCLSDSPNTIVTGCGIQAMINRQEIDNHCYEISSMIRQLPETFTTPMGDSFVNLCMTKDGLLWTGFHRTCDQLLVLGLAAGFMSFTVDRQFWHLLPGHMPLIRIHI